jgi:hypothetical protein
MTAGLSPRGSPALQLAGIRGFRVKMSRRPAFAWRGPRSLLPHL